VRAQQALSRVHRLLVVLWILTLLLLALSLGVSPARRRSLVQMGVGVGVLIVFFAGLHWPGIIAAAIVEVVCQVGVSLIADRWEVAVSPGT
jgi:hypothetical protein